MNSKKTRTHRVKHRLPKCLSSKQVFHACAPSQFSFKTTRNVQSTQDIISQERAVRAIRVGLGIRKPGYNIYVAGIQGTGKTSVIRTFLEEWSEHSEPPKDWIYVYNFKDSNRPLAIELEAGVAVDLRKEMDEVIKQLRQEIPNALQSEDYENAVNACVSQSNEVQASLFSQLEQLAKKHSFQIKSTRMGIETIPIVEGRTLTEKEYSKLSNKERKKIENARAKLEPEVLDFARKVRNVEVEAKQYVENLQKEIGRQVLDAILGSLREKYQDERAVFEHLVAVGDHILDNMFDFLEPEDGGGEEDGVRFALVNERDDRFRKYQVNVFVNNKDQEHAPVIIETNPTYYNLFGKIEKNVEHGMYLTDFSMVHAGAVHKASGGYLVLNALDIFKNPSVWETLKRVLKNRQGFIEDMGEQYSLLPTSGLRPEPIPLDIKVVLIGNDEVYRILYEMDEDFQKIFKIKADFDYKMPRNRKNLNAYASFIATRSQREELLPFDRSGVAAIIEHSSRLVEHQNFLSTRFGEIKDLTIEADFIAREHGSRSIRRIHVEEASDERERRVNLPEQSLMEMVGDGSILIDVDGERIGQINGLAVYDLGDYSFGKPGRITCTTSFEKDGLLNIERAVKMSGQIHDKGVLILQSYLRSILCKEKPLGFSASITFEQSYGMIDGDSATIAELIAIISALGKVPIAQNFAVTGSLNQFGDVQPVGGINEKVEGFYQVCEKLGRGEVYNVVIPHQNVRNLMLNLDTRKAVDAGALKIFAVESFPQAFELVTGVALGISDPQTSKIKKDSALASVLQFLEKVDAAQGKAPKD